MTFGPKTRKTLGSIIGGTIGLISLVGWVLLWSYWEYGDFAEFSDFEKVYTVLSLAFLIIFFLLIGPGYWLLNKINGTTVDVEELRRQQRAWRYKNFNQDTEEPGRKQEINH
jgi:hypothetical protein